jgi:serine/threonine protein phosphatase 1
MLVYLGDYVDRGADTCGVLERLCRKPMAGVRCILLKGNHEDMLLRFLHDAAVGNNWRLCGGMETLLSYKVAVNVALARDGLAALKEDFRKRLPLPHLELLHQLKPCAAIGDYFFCHAGVRPGVALARQQEADLVWIRKEFLQSAVDFGKIVVHGHSPVPEPEVRANRINIDTGAYMTHRLTCLVLEGDERRFLSTSA